MVGKGFWVWEAVRLKDSRKGWTNRDGRAEYVGGNSTC